MPSLLTEQITCRDCQESKPRVQFSVADNTCLDCFQQHYCFCMECGMILRQDRCYYPPLGYEYDYGYPQQGGGHLCYSCEHLRTNSYRERWRPSPLDVSFATYERIGSKVKFGVEIETAACSGFERLSGNTKFGAKTDCTVTGREFDSPVLYGDEGLDCIREFLAFGEDRDWRADHNCGCHTHYDMRDMTDIQLFSIAYAFRRTQSFWKALVPGHRRDGTYSHNPRWDCGNLKHAIERSNGSFEGMLQYLSTDRYDYVNLGAYYDHKTFEVRILEGTVDADDICNWITLNCRFIDAVKDMTIEEIDETFGRGNYATYRRAAFVAISEIIDDNDLADWILRRNRQHDQRHPLVAPVETE